MSGARIFIGLGANLGNPLETFGRAAGLLSENGCRVVGKSSIYKSKPYGFLDQADFQNAAIEVDTGWSPSALLGLMQSVEGQLGKKVVRENGPRVIDLDLLLYGDLVQNHGETPILPHPGVVGRDFVLLPLCDLAPGFVHPGTGKTLAEHLSGLGETFGTGDKEDWP